MDIFVIVATLIWLIGSMLFYMAWREQHEIKTFDWGFIFALIWPIPLVIWLGIRWFKRQRYAV